MIVGRKDVKPFLLKAGFALLFSLAAFFADRHCRRRRALSPPPPPPLPHLSDFDLEPPSSAEVLDEELPMHQTEEALAKTSPRAPVTVEDDHFSTSESSGEEEEEFPCLLPQPELNKLVQKEQEIVLETIPAAPLTDDFEVNDSVAMEEEIKNLRNLVQFFQERETCLEMKLLEYHGLKEQEVSMRELQNRLKLSATETKLLSLKIESLKAENEKLRAEAADYSRVVSELEMQKKNVAVLESKLRSVVEQAKEKMEVLHGRITELREKEKKDLEDSVKVEMELEVFKKMEKEVIELRKENARLAQEKLTIIKKLESEHKLNNLSLLGSPDSVLKIPPELGTLEEQNHLREENEKLKMKLEQLQTDRCEDVEELVYLRWINACLRYELRNHLPPPGRTAARDLSRCLSPKSEQKAKQLILDYSNPHSNLSRSNVMNFELDDCFSQTSSEEFDESSPDSSKAKSSKSSKSKLFSKLKKLVLAKGRDEDKIVKMRTGSDLNSERKSFGDTSGLSVEKANDSARMELYGNEMWQGRRNHSCDLTKSSLDIQNLRRLNQEEVNGGMAERCNSDLGVVYAHKRIPSLDENSTYHRSVENEDGEAEKDKLKKFAQVFKDSQITHKSKRRPASLSIG